MVAPGSATEIDYSPPYRVEKSGGVYQIVDANGKARATRAARGVAERMAAKWNDERPRPSLSPEAIEISRNLAEELAKDGTPDREERTMATETTQDELVDVEDLDEPGTPKGTGLVPIGDSRPSSLPMRREAVSMIEFLDEIASDKAMEAQRRLSAAYTDYCHAILDPATDMQEIEGKSFKKKSAWRKLGRAFQVSTEIVRREAGWEHDEEEGIDHFVAHYEVRATAPWGQYAEATGSCSTRESRFYATGVDCPVCAGPTWDNRPAITGKDANAPAWKKKLPPFTCRDKGCEGAVHDMEAVTERRPNGAARAKAEHDVRATAETRATNRAISNLIAAGEVSAEEVDGDGRSAPTETPTGGAEGSKASAPKKAAAGAPAGVPACPDCGGPMYDNRTPRADQPDWVAKAREKGDYAPFRCKKKDCGAEAWMESAASEKGALWTDVPYGIHAGKAWGWVVSNDPGYALKAVNRGEATGALADAIRATLPMTTDQRDALIGHLDAKDFSGAEAMQDWIKKVTAEGAKPVSCATAAEALEKIGALPEKGAVAEEPEDSYDDDLPF